MRSFATWLAAAALAGATPAAAAGVHGVWQTEATEDGRYVHVETHPCAGDAGKVCGTIVGAFGGARPDAVGRAIIWDMAPAGPGAWDGGRIWKADEDRTYDSEMRLSGDVLTVSGCVLGGLICKSQRWPRVR